MPKVSEEHLDARRRQIVDAAIVCFARDGFHRATMQDICREAQLSPGAIYRYFASKDEIIEAIADERHAREAGFMSQAQEVGGAEGLRALGRASFSSLADPDERRRRRSEEHTSELQSPCNLVCRLLLEKKKTTCFTLQHHTCP